MLAFTHGALNDLQGRYQLARLIVESMPSGFETPDHPSIVVFGKGTQNLGKLVTIFLFGSRVICICIADFHLKFNPPSLQVISRRRSFYYRRFALVHFVWNARNGHFWFGQIVTTAL